MKKKKLEIYVAHLNGTNSSKWHLITIVTENFKPRVKPPLGLEQRLLIHRLQL